MAGGGVLNNRGEYIEESALHAEHIMERPYEVMKVSKINETAVYLGLFIKQWGHFLVDFVPRLWHLINNDSDLKLVYISIGNQEIDGVYAEFLNVFGIDTKRVICIKSPTEFTNIIIPQTSYERPYPYYAEYKSIFDYMNSKIEKLNLSYQRYEKIYWTRTKLKKARKTETGEKVIEELFEANGYKVLSPEKLSLKEQLFYFSTCKKMAGISGTIPLTSCFQTVIQNS
ncbi:glycosyltransferase 61 family protein [Holdemania sp. Marseille-P2844]|uniref:glycosyltransferase 61 family protein n=1 Tax=Holdemania sp. Marseille-P2844 TaxID=1852366 RepID=UPI0009FA2872|nr:glycosyltransferase 61 family protein [Holdemania sp. Marseille-P2844]